ncbi:MAG: hypothetical protein KTR31_19700 [Myxococcales bacterium]|nr:hypothetical protein [Myxococcales bacterium]
MGRIRSVIVGVALVGCSGEFQVIPGLPPLDQAPPAPPEQMRQVDRILQTTQPEVDVLFMVDNSCSMGPEQSELAKNFPLFMEYFLNSGLAYHIGVVSSDMNDPAHQGKLQPGPGGILWLEPHTLNQVQAFSKMAVLGNGGASPEKGLGGIYSALESFDARSWNQGFYRDDAALHTMVIADEFDYTNGDPISIADFVSWYDGLKDVLGGLTFSTVVSDQPGASGPGGQDYGLVTSQIGGVNWDIGESSWFRVLDRLGVQAAGLSREYFLSRVPMEGTIEVEVHSPLVGGGVRVERHTLAVFDGDGTLVKGHYTYDEVRNSIVYVEYVPDSLAEVVLTYTALSAVP